MVCNRAFNLLLVGSDLLLAYNIEVGSREQAGSLNASGFFPKLRGAGKLQGCYVWWNPKIGIVDSTPL